MRFAGRSFCFGLGAGVGFALARLVSDVVVATYSLNRMRGAFAEFGRTMREPRRYDDVIETTAT